MNLHNVIIDIFSSNVFYRFGPLRCFLFLWTFYTTFWTKGMKAAIMFYCKISRYLMINTLFGNFLQFLYFFVLFSLNSSRDFVQLRFLVFGDWCWFSSLNLMDQIIDMCEKLQRYMTYCEYQLGELNVRLVWSWWLIFDLHGLFLLDIRQRFIVSLESFRQLLDQQFEDSLGIILFDDEIQDFLTDLEPSWIFASEMSKQKVGS